VHQHDAFDFTQLAVAIVGALGGLFLYRRRKAATTVITAPPPISGPEAPPARPAGKPRPAGVTQLVMR
jgi:hypothetical protein